MDCSLPGSSLRGILHARILEWVAISFSRGSSWPRNWTRVSRIAGRLFNLWAKKDISGLLHPFFCVRTQRGVSHLQPGKGPSLDHANIGSLTYRLQKCEEQLSVGNKPPGVLPSITAAWIGEDTDLWILFRGLDWLGQAHPHWSAGYHTSVQPGEQRWWGPLWKVTDDQHISRNSNYLQNLCFQDSRSTSSLLLFSKVLDTDIVRGFFLLQSSPRCSSKTCPPSFKTVTSREECV